MTVSPSHTTVDHMPIPGTYILGVFSPLGTWSFESHFQTSQGTSPWLHQLCARRCLFSNLYQPSAPAVGSHFGLSCALSIPTLKSYLTSEPLTATVFGDRSTKRESSSNEVTTAGPNPIELPYRKRKFGSTEGRPGKDTRRGWPPASPG